MPIVKLPAGTHTIGMLSVGRTQVWPMVVHSGGTTAACPEVGVPAAVAVAWAAVSVACTAAGEPGSAVRVWLRVPGKPVGEAAPRPETRASRRGKMNQARAATNSTPADAARITLSGRRGW